MNYFIVPGIKARFRKECAPIIGTEKICLEICEYFSVKMDDLQSKYRGRRISYPRQVCMYLMHKHAKAYLREIGSFFNRDHTTVIAARETIKDLIFSSDIVRDDIEKLEYKLYATYESN